MFTRMGWIDRNGHHVATTLTFDLWPTKVHPWVQVDICVNSLKAFLRHCIHKKKTNRHEVIVTLTFNLICSFSIMFSGTDGGTTWKHIASGHGCRWHSYIKMLSIWWLLFKCVDLLSVSVLYECKWNISRFSMLVGKNKCFEDGEQALEEL